MMKLLSPSFIRFSLLLPTFSLLQAQDVNKGYHGYEHDPKHVVTKTVDETGQVDPMYWVNEVPAGCPFAPSKDFEGVLFTGRYANYTKADTFYPSWAEDGHLYSQWTDGWIKGDFCGSLGTGATTGSVRIEGDDPMNLTVVNLGKMNQSPSPSWGRYPCANLVYNGTWYSGSYLLANAADPDECDTYSGTQIEGYMGVRTATMPDWKEGAVITKNDYPWNRYITDWSEKLNHDEQGRPIWKIDERIRDGRYPVFGEYEKDAEIRFGAPHFVDFGKNMEHAPVVNGQKMAYLVGSGALQHGAYNSWCHGDAIFLARVAPNPETINDVKSWEFYAGKDAQGLEKWSHNIDDVQPILQWDSHLGNVAVTYNKALDRYVMCYSRGRKKYEYDTAILIAKELTGPYEMVHYFPRLGPVTYFGNFPSKFISEDGLSMWMCYSSNFFAQHLVGNPPYSKYSLSMRELRLVKRGEKGLPEKSGPRPEDLQFEEPIILDKANIAPLAQVRVSSTMVGYPKVSGLTDEVTEGWPRNASHEWRSDGETKGAWIELVWDQARDINHLHVAQNWKRGERITRAHLEFNGKPEDSLDISAQLAPSALTKEAITCSGSLVADIVLPQVKSVKSLKLVIDEVQAGDKNVNITEIRVFNHPTHAEGIQFNKAQQRIYVGDSMKAVVELLPVNTLADTLTHGLVNWQSSDPSIATVQDGVITAHQEGKCIISVESKMGQHRAEMQLHARGIPSEQGEIKDFDIIENSSVTFGSLKNMTDGNRETYLTSYAGVSKYAFFTLDLKQSYCLGDLQLVLPKWGDSREQIIAVYVGNEKIDTRLIAPKTYVFCDDESQAQFNDNTLTIDLNKTKARFIKVECQGTKHPKTKIPAELGELRIFKEEV